MHGPIYIRSWGSVRGPDKMRLNWRILNKKVQAKRFQKQLGTILLAVCLSVRPFARSLDRNILVTVGTTVSGKFLTYLWIKFKTSYFPWLQRTHFRLHVSSHACQSLLVTSVRQKRQTVGGPQDRF